MAVYHADLAGISGKQGFVHFRMPAAAEWALEVTELNDSDRSIFGTERVRALGGDVVTDVLRFLGRDLRTCDHRTVRLARRLYVRGSHSPCHITDEDPHRKRQYHQHRVKMAPFERDSIFLFNGLLYFDEMLNLNRFDDWCDFFFCSGRAGMAGIITC